MTSVDASSVFSFRAIPSEVPAAQDPLHLAMHKESTTLKAVTSNRLDFVVVVELFHGMITLTCTLHVRMFQIIVCCC